MSDYDTDHVPAPTPHTPPTEVCESEGYTGLFLQERHGSGGWVYCEHPITPEP